MDEPPDSLGPQLAGHIALGAANAAYEQWLRDDTSDLDELVHRAFSLAPLLPELARKPPGERR